MDPYSSRYIIPWFRVEGLEQKVGLRLGLPQSSFSPYLPV